MPVATRSEFYFIIAMMFLILVVCAVAIFAFIRTYKKEMREKREREAAKENADPTE